MDDNGTNLAQTAQVRAELHRLLPVLSRLTGLPSRWNGELVLVPDAGFKGKKLFSCSVLLDAALASRDVRWRTLIHESLHALSVGYNRMDFEALSGWEEGVVEQLQRLLRPEVLIALGVSLEEAVFAPAEAAHPYNRYIRVLEELRQGLNLPGKAFYCGLLATPIKDRPAFVYGLGKNVPEGDRTAFTRTFSVATTTLKRRI